MMATRVLNSADADRLQELRLLALRQDGKFFTANYQEEKAMTAAQWAAAATETTKQAMFGAFDGGELVGIMGARQWERSASEETVYWRALYVLPPYRRLGIAEDLHTLCDLWSRAHGYKKAVFSIHPENKEAIRLVKEWGATPYGLENAVFANGATAPAVWYRKNLAPPCAGIG